MEYKIGDQVKIKSLDWYNENKDEDGDVFCGEYDFVDLMTKFCSKIVTIENCYEHDCYTIKEDNEGFVFTGEMFEGLAEEEITNITDKDKRLICWIKEPNRYRLIPDKNYEIKYDEKGFFYLEKKKKEYPKTYEDCSLINGAEDRISLSIIGKFTKLINARNAYWKIAGEEMGLGKPWEPDWTNFDQLKHCIWVDAKEFVTITNVKGQHILAFPTAEMRDAFYENFKELIEECKDFL